MLPVAQKIPQLQTSRNGGASHAAQAPRGAWLHQSDPASHCDLARDASLPPH